MTQIRLATRGPLAAGAAVGMVFCLIAGPGFTAGDDRSPAPSANARVPEFERDIAPLLRAHCQKCHGEGSRKAGLDLRTMAGILQGGESGDPAIVPGKANESLLARLVTEKTMPPGKLPKLDGDQVGRIKAWIDAGAPAGSSTEDSRSTKTPAAVLARKVGDIFDFNCIVCHGRSKKEGGLDLTDGRIHAQGWENRAGLTPGKSAESLLVRRIRDDEMPTRLGRSEAWSNRSPPPSSTSSGPGSTLGPPSLRAGRSCTAMPAL